jgi:hypothetical protein
MDTDAPVTESNAAEFQENEAGRPSSVVICNVSYPVAETAERCGQTNYLVP